MRNTAVECDTLLAVQAKLQRIYSTLPYWRAWRRGLQGRTIAIRSCQGGSTRATVARDKPAQAHNKSLQCVGTLVNTSTECCVSYNHAGRSTPASSLAPETGRRICPPSGNKALNICGDVRRLNAASSCKTVAGHAAVRAPEPRC